MPNKRKSRSKKGAGMFDFLGFGESASYTKQRCKEYENEISKLEKRIEELKSKQQKYKCLAGANMDMQNDNNENPMMQNNENTDFNDMVEQEQGIQMPNDLENENEFLEDEQDVQDDEVIPNNLYNENGQINSNSDPLDELDQVNAPEDRKTPTITKPLSGGRRRRKSRRKTKKSKKRRRKKRKTRKNKKKTKRLC